jgi:GPH family glycoside/pentoside/hexuronide:cation symporter
MFFSILGSLLAFTVPLMIVGSFSPENQSRVLLMGQIFGLLSALPMFLVFFGTREREDFLETDRPKLWHSIQAAWKNIPFRYSLGIFLATWISVDILQSSLLFYIKYVIQKESQNDLIMAMIFVVAMLALPIWDWVSRRWSKRLAYIYGIAFWAVVQILLITVSPQTPLSLVLVLCAMAGIGVAAAHVLPWAIIHDTIDFDEYHTGKRHEGMFYSITTLTRKVASAFAIPLIGPLLELTGYQANTLQQSPQALMGIRLVIGPVPALLLGVGILIAFRYPLGREEFIGIVEKLRLRRAG